MHEFVIKDKGKLVTYTDFDSIPNEFDHIIKFVGTEKVLTEVYFCEQCHYPINFD